MSGLSTLGCTFRSRYGHGVRPGARTPSGWFERAYRMPCWQRTLLVVCALPLGEVSCGVDRVTFLHLVSVRVDIRPEFACADASLGSAAAGKHLGLASGCFFGLSGVDCAVSSGDDAAVDARFVMLSDVVASCGVLVVASHRFLLHLVGLAFGRVIVLVGLGLHEVSCAVASCVLAAADAPVVIISDLVQSCDVTFDASHRSSLLSHGVCGSACDRVARR